MSVGRVLAVLALMAALSVTTSGCATISQDPPPDPLEKVNRPVYRFNDKLEKVTQPVANAYTTVTPLGFRIAISSFFDNLGYPNVIVNDLLQGKIKQCLADLAHFVVNTTLGMGGLFDVASRMGLPAHDEDFGQTLGYWGAGGGAYLVLPVIGPNTVRDAPGLAVTAVTNLLFYVSQTVITVPLGILAAVDRRASADKALEVVDQSALDPYVFVREGYLQRRLSLIYDGNPPLSDDLYDVLDEDAPPAK